MSLGHMPSSTCLGSGWVTSTEGEELASSVLGIVSTRASRNHQSECVRHNTLWRENTSEPKPWISSDSLSLPWKKKKSPYFSPSSDPKSIPTISGLPTLARVGQVICKGPTASSSCFLHKPRHKELMQCTAFEECLKEAEHVLCSVNRAWRILLVKGRKNQYGYLKM